MIMQCLGSTSKCVKVSHSPSFKCYPSSDTVLCSTVRWKVQQWVGNSCGCDAACKGANECNSNVCVHKLPYGAVCPSQSSGLCTGNHKCRKWKTSGNDLRCCNWYTGSDYCKNTLYSGDYCKKNFQCIGCTCSGGTCCK